MLGSVRAFRTPCFTEHVLGQTNRDSQFGFGPGVFLLVGRKQLPQGSVVVFIAPFGVGNVPF